MIPQSMSLNAQPTYPEPKAERPITLTLREIEVLRLLSGGCTYKKISALLGISLHTVCVHIKNVYRKLDVHTAPGAVMRAVQLGLLSQDSRASGTRHDISLNASSLLRETAVP